MTPGDLEPGDLEPGDLEPSDLEPSDLEPSDLEPSELDPSEVDFAIAAFREEGRWSVAVLPARIATSAQSLIAALRQLPGEGGAFGFVGVDEEYFVALRESGGRTRGFISDAMAILDSPLAEELAEILQIDADDEELEDYYAIGDLSIFADFGLDADGVDLVCEDEDLTPDEQVRSIANRMGFGAELRAVQRHR
jgi:putative tRNA adenosine deaminase-associated protein